ncbi:hypothetical protein MLD38_003618 [Melastoma candidum]|uniref:Uncharacterized protein n=1 Tax=Melastoma candidum TaxID=119954 RepID=A0ACB9S371_9MYRT|nr:hypothetical protein MLD38_003618 [Melastoma candidum]
MSSTLSSPRGIGPPPMRLDPYDPPRGHNSVDNEAAELLSVSWNQDFSCLAAGTSRGFRIYNCEPFKETFRRDLKTRGFKIVEMLFRCNILALVGGATNSQYPPDKVACITLTMDGLLLATASVKGTLIRIFNTVDGTRLQEVRRGVDRAEIYNIALSPNVQWLAVSSDKGTVHIFGLRVRVASEDTTADSSGARNPSLLYQNSSNALESLLPPNTGANPGSSLSFMRGVLPKYFSSEWSFAQFLLPEQTQFIAAFGSQNTVVIAGMDGSFYRCSFDPVNGGQMLQQEYVRFLKSDGRHRYISSVYPQVE